MKILELLTKSRQTGNIGERAAEKFLKKSGYKIRKRNFVAFSHEIDLIAEDGTTVAFVEVKARTIGHESKMEPRPASKVTPEKQRAIITAARAYAPYVAHGMRLRFDVIEVFIDEKTKKAVKINHIKAAFNHNTAFPKGVGNRS